MVMCFAESADVPFTVIYERFPTGYYERLHTAIILSIHITNIHF